MTVTANGHAETVSLSPGALNNGQEVLLVNSKTRFVLWCADIDRSERRHPDPKINLSVRFRDWRADLACGWLRYRHEWHNDQRRAEWSDH